jgi:hypothetical protein
VQPRPGRPARTVLDHAAALARADRILVTAHPAEPVASVALRAGDGALESYLTSGGPAWPPHAVAGAAGPAEERPVDAGDAEEREATAVGPLRRLLARHLSERLPDGHAGELHAAVVAAAVVAALDLAVAHWLADGARADGADGCRVRFHAVAPLLPRDP